MHAHDAAALQAIDLSNWEAELEVREAALQRQKTELEVREAALQRDETELEAREAALQRHEIELQRYRIELRRWAEVAEADLRQRGQELCQRGKAVEQVCVHITHSSLPQAAPS